jgi:hypothetical protein
MQAILILTITVTLLLLPGSSTAETYAECQTRCANEKATREEVCPPPDQYEEADQARAQCLQDSEKAYTSCLNGCPPLPSPDK